MINVLLNDLKFDIDKWNKDSKIRFTYRDVTTRFVLQDWAKGCTFNTVCDIVNGVMAQGELNNLVSFVIKAGAGEIEYEHE